jgi:hypothetical protein
MRLRAESGDGAHTGRAAEDARTFTERRPARPGAGEGATRQIGRGEHRGAHIIIAIGGIAQRHFHTRGIAIRKKGNGTRGQRAGRGEISVELPQHVIIRQIEPSGILAGAENGAGQRDSRMRRARRHNCGGKHRRIGDQIIDRSRSSILQPSADVWFFKLDPSASVPGNGLLSIFSRSHAATSSSKS